MFIEFMENIHNRRVTLNTDHITAIDPSSPDGDGPATLQVIGRGAVQVTVPYRGVLEMLKRALDMQATRGRKGVDAMVDLEAEFDNQGRGENLA